MENVVRGKKKWRWKGGQRGICRRGGLVLASWERSNWLSVCAGSAEHAHELPHQPINALEISPIVAPCRARLAVEAFDDDTPSVLRRLDGFASQVSQVNNAWEKRE